MSIRLACSDAAFPLLEHDDCIALIGILGVDGIDVGLFEERSKLQPSMVFDNPGKKGKELKGKASKSGLTVADVFFQPALDFIKSCSRLKSNRTSSISRIKTLFRYTKYSGPKIRCR